MIQDREDVAQYINELNNDDFNDIKTEQRMEWLESIVAEKDLSPSMKKARYRLYKSLPLGEDFMAAEQKNIFAFFDKIETQDWFLTAQKKWLFAGNYEKLGFLNKIASEYCKIEGLPSVQTGDASNKNPMMRDYGPAASYDFKMQKISFNTDPRNGVLGQFGKSLNYTIHELMHHQQFHLSESYKKGQIKRDNPKYYTARLFAANYADGGYAQSSGLPFNTHKKTAYFSQPIETHAFTIGNNIGKRYSILQKLKNQFTSKITPNTANITKDKGHNL